MINTRTVYIALMFIAGIVLGAIVAAYPALSQAAVPPITVLLLVSFVIDVAAMLLADRAGSQPVTMNTRLTGFFGAAIIYLAITMLAGTPA